MLFTSVVRRCLISGLVAKSFKLNRCKCRYQIRITLKSSCKYIGYQVQQDLRWESSRGRRIKWFLPACRARCSLPRRPPCRDPADRSDQSIPDRPQRSSRSWPEFWMSRDRQLLFNVKQKKINEQINNNQHANSQFNHLWNQEKEGFSFDKEGNGKHISKVRTVHTEAVETEAKRRVQFLWPGNGCQLLLERN